MIGARTTSSQCRAAMLATALDGHKGGSGWMARCPAHNDKTPSLSIHDSGGGMVLLHCHAGCRQERVIQVLRQLGLWNVAARQTLRQMSRQRPVAACPGRPEIIPSDAAAGIWSASRPAQGTLVERYLRSRGIVLPAPDSLRFHPALRHPCGARWPAMVARVTAPSGVPMVAIHRTFLSRDGSGKASVTPARMMLGSCRSASVQLAPASDPLMVGEGIETCLAAMQATGHAAWAALSTSGLRSLVLPPGICNVIILADGDDPGEAAARDCARRWAREGRHVRIARSPRGTDFNDLLSGRTSRFEDTMA